jgi:hypothetical protein
VFVDLRFPDVTEASSASRRPVGNVYVGVVGSWGVASFENDAAGDWFLIVEEAPDPGAVMAAAIDDVLSLEGRRGC